MNDRDDATPAERLRDVGEVVAHVACDIQRVASDLDQTDPGRRRADDTARADGGTPTGTTSHPDTSAQQWRPRPVDDAGYRQTMTRLAFGGSGLGLMYAGVALSSFNVVAGLFALLLAIGAGYYGLHLRSYDSDAPVQGGETA